MLTNVCHSGALKTWSSKITFGGRKYVSGVAGQVLFLDLGGGYKDAHFAMIH